jgi:hypothetical protein
MAIIRHATHFTARRREVLLGLNSPDSSMAVETLDRSELK